MFDKFKRQRRRNALMEASGRVARHGISAFSIEDMLSGRGDRSMDELIAFVREDKALVSVLEEAGANDDTLRGMYQDLCFAGAGQWEGGVYVPVAALTQPETLAFVLKHKVPPGDGFESAWRMIAIGLLEYFRTNDKKYLSAR